MIKRILLIRPDKIGDLILTLPMATAIKSSVPGAQVAFLVRDYTAPLLTIASDVDGTVLYDKNLSLWQTVSLLRKYKPDAVFFFGSKFKLTLAAFLARIPIRVGRAYWWYSFLYNRKIYEHRKNANYNEAEYNVRMLRAIGIETPDVPLPFLYQSKLPNVSLPFSRYIVLHIATGGSAQAWNSEHYIELASWLKQAYNYPIILTGTADDHEYLFRIAERMKLSSCNVHIMTGNTLLELAGILVSAKLMISAGTGPGHLAAALGTPTIGLFPNVITLSKERWGFRGKKVINLSPLKMKTNQCPNCKNCTCIDEVTVSQVISAISELKISE